ncbi:hypothetical protein HMPREF9374_0302 [Desmospora sp. 8437]|nr:hypothetical protein HMPREF9374_0302 [Desmospora sp. 8437]
MRPAFRSFWRHCRSPRRANRFSIFAITLSGRFVWLAAAPPIAILSPAVVGVRQAEK